MPTASRTHMKMGHSCRRGSGGEPSLKNGHSYRRGSSDESSHSKTGHCGSGDESPLPKIGRRESMDESSQSKMDRRGSGDELLHLRMGHPIRRGSGDEASLRYGPLNSRAAAKRGSVDIDLLRRSLTHNTDSTGRQEPASTD